MTDPVVVGADKNQMGLLLLIIGSVLGLILILGVAVLLAAALRWLFWMIVRLGLAGLMAGAIALGGELIDADGGAIALAAILAFIAALMATRHWGRAAATTPATSHTAPAPTRPALPDPPPLIPADLRARLDATERALAHAARDAHGAMADEWLTIWRRRVPDLIAAAQAHHDDRAAAGRAEVTAQLARRLDDLIAEAEHRIAIARQSRGDEFTIRANHAEYRARNG